MSAQSFGPRAWVPGVVAVVLLAISAVPTTFADSVHTVGQAASPTATSPVAPPIATLTETPTATPAATSTPQQATAIKLPAAAHASSPAPAQPPPSTASD